ncbi:hypothetical protein BDZ45DRAFT_769138 [Acephala macrosclerotiorum]|nr:hypothetical protein BDZ45DRAFT_769138 [Acephala macrosclerotiorum]
MGDQQTSIALLLAAWKGWSFESNDRNLEHVKSLTLDSSSLDTDDTIQFDLWTHCTDDLQDAIISTIDNPINEQRPEFDPSGLSTTQWDTAQPSEQFSNSETFNSAGHNMEYLPISAAHCDPFSEYEIASDLPAQSGLLYPSQAGLAIQYISSRPRINTNISPSTIELVEPFNGDSRWANFRLRSKDATKRERNFLVPLLKMLPKVSTMGTFLGIMWQTFFLAVQQTLLTDLEIRRIFSEKNDKQGQLNVMISAVFQVFKQKLATSQFASILNWHTQAKTHLDIYCAYWLKKLAIENGSLEPLDFSGVYNLFSDLFKRLALDNYARLESHSGSLVGQERLFNHVFQSISRTGFMCEGDMSIFHELLSGDTKIRYQDFTENDSSSDAILPGNQMEGVDKFGTIVEQFLDALSKDSRFGSKFLSRKEKPELIEMFKLYNFRLS